MDQRAGWPSSIEPGAKNCRGLAGNHGHPLGNRGRRIHWRHDLDGAHQPADYGGRSAVRRSALGRGATILPDALRTVRTRLNHPPERAGTARSALSR